MVKSFLSRFKLLFVIPAAALLPIALVLVFGPKITIDIPETTVREAVAAELPKVIESRGITIHVRGADIDFRGDDKVHIEAFVDVSGYGFSGAGRADVTSGLAYRNGDFFLEDFMLQDLDLTPTGESVEKAQDAKSVAAGLWGKAKAAIAEHETGADAAMQRIADRVLPAARLSALDAIDRGLKTIPVYSLNGRSMKHSVAALALHDLAFSDTEVHVVLDPRQVVLAVILGALGFILAIGGTLGFMFGHGVRHP